jgi:hypothetical protein
MTREQPEKYPSSVGRLGLLVGVILCIGFTALFVGIGVVGLYGLSSDAVPFRLLAQVFPFPAARVNGDLIRYSVWSADTRAFVGLAEAGKESIPDALTRHDIAQNVLDRLVRNQVLERITEEKGIHVTDSEVDAEYARVTGKKEDAVSMKASLKALGWSVADLKTQIIRPYLLGKRLTERMGSVAAGDALLQKALKEAEVEVYVRF